MKDSVNMNKAIFKVSFAMFLLSIEFHLSQFVDN